jgi:hypothetical protein
VTGGEETRKCTSLAPASRSSFTSLRAVFPRTTESSITTTRFFEMMLGKGFSFRRNPSWRMLSVGWINVRPT